MNNTLPDTVDRQQEDPFMRFNHIEVESAEYGRAILRLEICPESRNFRGTVNQGIISAIADKAVEIAAQSDGCMYKIRSCSLSFLNHQSEGIIRAEACIRCRDRSGGLAEVDVTGPCGTLLATGTYTLFS